MTTPTIKPESDFDPAELIALHRSIFGDARMETDEGAGDDEGGSEGSGEGSDDDGTDGADDGEGQSDEGGDEDDSKLPEWARTKMSKANREAASYRTRLRELEKKFEGAKTAEEFEAAQQELKDENAKLAREALVAKVARKHKLPDELADRLRGDDEAALEEDAKSLLKFATADDDEPEDLSGGLTPKGGSSTDDDDPRKLAETYGGRRKNA